MAAGAGSNCGVFDCGKWVCTIGDMVMATIKIKTLSTGEVADLMGLSTASVRRFAIDGILKGRRHGARAWVFDEDDVRKFVRSYEASLDPSVGGGPRGPRTRTK